MAYRPVTPSKRICAHCQDVFEAKDRRRIYCSSSCNTLAWMARQPKQEKEGVSSQKGELAFSLNNVATVAAGSALASGANYVFNDAPFYKALGDHLAKLEHYMGYQAGKADAMNKRVNQFMNAVRRSSPDVDFQLSQLEGSEAKKLLG